MIDALVRRYDIALYFNVGNSPVTWIPRIAGQRVVLNVDGLDWKRKKWGRFARWYIRSCERWATRVPHRLVTDSRRVEQYYRERHGTLQDVGMTIGSQWEDRFLVARPMTATGRVPNDRVIHFTRVLGYSRWPGPR